MSIIESLKDFGKHIWFMLTYPKIGPDMYLTHWLLYLKPLRLLFQSYKIREIGQNSEIRPYCMLIGTNNIIIGRNVIIPPGTILVTNPDDVESVIVIEDDVLFGPNSAIYASTHNFADPDIPAKLQGYTRGKTTIIRSGAWVGINVVIMPGVIVGKNSIIGANSVVTNDVPARAVVAGIPARVLRTR